jgi:hypothetical protein
MEMADEAEFVSRILIGNELRSGKARVVYVEPWGRDYTLLAGEELEIFAFGDERLPSFGIVELDGQTQVYCDHTWEAVVHQGGEEIQCGHKRDTNLRDL